MSMFGGALTITTVSLPDGGLFAIDTIALASTSRNCTITTMTVIETGGLGTGPR